MGTGQSLAESTPAPAAEAVSSVPAAPQEFDYAGAWQSAGEQFLQQQAGAVDTPLAPPSLPGEPPVAPVTPSEPALAPVAPTDVAPVASQGQRPSEAVPYERFQQVNSENQRLIQEAQQAREHAAAVQKAAAAGFATVQEYQQADAYAKQNNYVSIEAMQITFKNAKQLQDYDQTLTQKVNDGEISEWTKQEMLQMRAQNLQSQAMHSELLQQQKFTQTQLVEQAMTNATNQFAQFGIPMPPALADHLRTQNPVDIARIAGEQVNWMKQVVSNSNGQYAATKLAQQQQVPPMGAGGAPPPPMQPAPRDQQFNPATSSFADAAGYDLDRLDRDFERLTGQKLTPRR